MGCSARYSSAPKNPGQPAFGLAQPQHVSPQPCLLTLPSLVPVPPQRVRQQVPREQPEPVPPVIGAVVRLALILLVRELLPGGLDDGRMRQPDPEAQVRRGEQDPVGLHGSRPHERGEGRPADGGHVKQREPAPADEGFVVGGARPQRVVGIGAAQRRVPRVEGKAQPAAPGRHRALGVDVSRGAQDQSRLIAAQLRQARPRGVLRAERSWVTVVRSGLSHDGVGGGQPPPVDVVQRYPVGVGRHARDHHDREGADDQPGLARAVPGGRAVLHPPQRDDKAGQDHQGAG